MRKYRVFLGLPAYKVPWDPHFTMSVQDAMAHPGLDIDFKAVIGDAHIERARACVLKNYLEANPEKKYEFFLNVDWDIEFRAHDLYRACERMEQYNLDILGGPYSYKSDVDGKKDCIVFRCLQDQRPDPETYLLGCDYVGGGFTMVRAAFLQKMMDSYPDLRFELNPDLDPKQTSTWALWNPILLPRPDWGEGKRELLSEDYSFCHRGKELGGKIVMDLTIALNHWDGDKCYTLPMKPEEEVKNERRGVRDVEGKPVDEGNLPAPGTEAATGV